MSPINSVILPNICPRQGRVPVCPGIYAFLNPQNLFGVIGGAMVTLIFDNANI